MKFEIGDVVYLKSGSPAMTVRGEATNDPGDVAVDYFDENRRFYQTFSPNQLTKENPGNKSLSVIQGY